MGERGDVTDRLLFDPLGSGIGFVLMPLRECGAIDGNVRGYQTLR